MSKKSRKSQTEVIGLVVIVMIIAFALLFFTSRSFTKKPDTLKKYYSDTNMANKLLTSMMKTTVPDCKGSTIQDLYEDHVTVRAIKCKGMESEKYAQIAVNTILGETLEKWNVPYNYYVYQSSGSTLRAIPVFGPIEKCNTKTKEKQVASLAMPLNPGTMTVQLEICPE